MCKACYINGRASAQGGEHNIYGGSLRIYVQTMRELANVALQAFAQRNIDGNPVYL